MPDRSEPTKAQMKKLTKIALDYEEHSSYVLLHDGTAIAVLHDDDNTKYAKVDRKGRVIDITKQINNLPS